MYGNSQSNLIALSSVKDYMDGEVTHVITQEQWDEKFDQVCMCVCVHVYVVCMWMCMYVYVCMF